MPLNPKTLSSGYTMRKETNTHTQASLTELEDTKLSIPIMISVQECSQNNRFNWKFFKPEDLPVVPWSWEDSSRQPTLSYNSQSRVYVIPQQPFRKTERSLTLNPQSYRNSSLPQSYRILPQGNHRQQGQLSDKLSFQHLP